MHATTMRTRSAFSLVELLVVIAIIAVLMTLSVGIVRQVVEGQQGTNTDAAMRTAYGTLQKHWSFVVDSARKETPSPQVMALAGNDPVRAQVIWVKLRLLEAFPKSFDEVLTPAPAYYYIPAGNRKNLAAYKRALTGANTGSPLDVQSAACLLMALSAPRGGSQALTATNLGSNIADTDGDGIKELVDGWAHAMRFERFPTQDMGATEPALNGLQAQNPSKSPKAAKYCDPLDPDGLLMNSTWQTSSCPDPLALPGTTTCLKEFERVLHKINSLTPGTANYIVPVLISRGAVTSDPNDDIASFFMKLQ